MEKILAGVFLANALYICAVFYVPSLEKLAETIALLFAFGSVAYLIIYASSLAHRKFCSRKRNAHPPAAED